MSERGNTSGRPTESARATRQREGFCIDGCGRESKTQRCSECSRRVEANTERFRGQSRPGHRTLVDDNLLDFRMAAEELGKACAGHLDVRQLGPLPARKRDELLGDPLHHAHLAWKFIGETLARSGLLTKSRRCKTPAKPQRDAKPQKVVQLQLTFRFAECR